jgi:hypothetical protein
MRRVPRPPVLAQAVGVVVAELAAGLARLGGQLPFRRWVDGAAMLVEEQAKHQVDRTGLVVGGDNVAATKRLPEQACELLGGFGAGGEATGGAVSGAGVRGRVADAPGLAALSGRRAAR